MNVVILTNKVFVKANLVNAHVRLERSIFHGLFIIKLTHLTLRWDSDRYTNKRCNG